MTRCVAVVFPKWRQHHGQLGEEHAYLLFEQVVRAISDVSPLIEVEDLGTIVLAARGPSRYFGGDELLAQYLFDICHNTHSEIPCGVGIADSRFAAMAAAHLSVTRGRPCVIDKSVTEAFIDALPVAALGRLCGVSVNTVDLFERLGLRTCAAVRAVGQSALIDRFGIEGSRVYQLICADDVRIITPGVTPSDFAAVLDIETPLTNAAHVVAVARKTIESVVQTISGHGQQCIRLMMSCETDHAEHVSRIWGEPRGFSVPVIAQRLLCQLEGWLTDASADPDAPTSGVVRVEFTPLECREVLVVQPLLWGGQQENTERASRAATMALAVDDTVEVCVPRWEGGRDVATVYSRVPVSLVNLSDLHAGEKRVMVGDGVAREWSGSVPRPSPAAIAPSPPPIRLIDVTGRDVGVTSRHELDVAPVVVEVGRHRYHVERVGGPWPVEERWWDPRRKRRHVRLQLLVRHTSGAVGVFLVGLEHQQWTLLARYE